MTNDEFKVYYINHRNTKFGGHVELDQDGFASIYINARRSSGQQLKTFEHELKHLENNDLHNDDPIEVIEARAAGKQAQPARQSRRKPRKKPAYLEMSNNLQEEAQAMFGLSPRDRRWGEIFWAMTITELQNHHHNRKRPELRRTFYYPPVKIKMGRMYKSPANLPAFSRHEQRQVLGVPWMYR